MARGQLNGKDSNSSSYTRITCRIYPSNYKPFNNSPICVNLTIINCSCHMRTTILLFDHQSAIHPPPATGLSPEKGKQHAIGRKTPLIRVGYQQVGIIKQSVTHGWIPDWSCNTPASLSLPLSIIIAQASFSQRWIILLIL